MKEGLVPNIVHYTNQLTLMHEMLRYDLGSAIEPYPSFADVDLVTIPFKERMLIPIRVWWDPDIPHNSAFRDFMSYLDNYLKNNDISRRSMKHRT